MAAEGCSVNYSVIRQNEELFIIATVTSDRLIFADNPIMKLKNFNGDIIGRWLYNKLREQEMKKDSF